MGEYAIRKSDGAEIKIGTCEMMYYLRYEDRSKVSHKPGNVNPALNPAGLYFRLPFPDEDGLLPGEYEHYNRGLRLYRMVDSGVVSRGQYPEWFCDETTTKHPGTIQLRHEGSGLLLNVPCYHGVKLPDVQEPMRAFWNGKGHSFELESLKAVSDESGAVSVYPVVKCRHCGQSWRYDWADVMEYIEPAMRERLAQYAEPSAQAVRS